MKHGNCSHCKHMMKNESKSKTTKSKKTSSTKTPRAKAKIEKVMKEFGAGHLHSGSKKGPVVTKRPQAVAIALSESRKAKK